MRRRVLLVILVHAVLVRVTAAVATGASDALAWRPSQLMSDGLRHSEIALMPEGTPADYELFRPLRPTVVAWGEDALAALDGGERARNALAANTAAYRKLGVSRVASNVWMLTATERYLHAHPEYQAAVCVDLWGERILPRWLADADYHGVKPWWGCSNHPLFREQLMRRMRAGLAAGATMVHLDDHAGTAACAAHAGGCFCEYCLRGFGIWLEQNLTAGDLAAVGVTDPRSFNYRELLLKRGYADRAGFISEAARGRVPMWSWFLEYQRGAAVGLIKQMQRDATERAGHSVPFGVNAYNLEPTQLFDAHIADYFANEVEQFDREDLIPPLVYRLGEALGRPVFATGTGEDWISYRKGRATARVRGWIAQAYAFGQYFMYSWKKWGFSEETGTLWTEVDPEIFRPMCEFVRGNPELFDGLETTAAVGLLYDNASAKAGRWGVRSASKALLDAGVPYALVVNGDALLLRTLTMADLERYRVLVMPSDVRRLGDLNELLGAWERRGGRIVNATPGESLPADLPGRVACQSASRVWCVPRVSGGAAGMVGKAVVHLLNRDYRAADDAFTPQRDLLVTVDAEIVPAGAATKSAWYFEPGKPPRELALTRGHDGQLTVTIPTLEIWGILALR